MRNHVLNLRRLCALALLLGGVPAAAAARGPAAGMQTDIPALIKKLKDDKDEVAVGAAEELRKIGRAAVAPLQEFIGKEKGCRPRVLTAQLLLGLAPESEAVVPAMLEVLKDGCYWSPQRDMAVRRAAALVLAHTPAGVSALAELLKGKSVFNRFERRSAVFAFDELTEKLGGARPDRLDPTPELISATKAAIPSLVEALADKDEVVHCMAYESLEQLRASPHRELREEAERLTRGVEARCLR